MGITLCIPFTHLHHSINQQRRSKKMLLNSVAVNLHCCKVILDLNDAAVSAYSTFPLIKPFLSSWFMPKSVVLVNS